MKKSMGMGGSKAGMINKAAAAQPKRSGKGGGAPAAGVGNERKASKPTNTGIMGKSDLKGAVSHLRGMSK